MTTEEIIHIFENSRIVSEHFDSEAVTAAYIEGLAALWEQEEREKPKPLTLEELRKMDGEPVWVVCAIGEASMWYIVDLDECELKNPWDCISLDYWDDGYPYSAYRSKPKE